MTRASAPLSGNQAGQGPGPSAQRPTTPESPPNDEKSRKIALGTFDLHHTSAQIAKYPGPQRPSDRLLNAAHEDALERSSTLESKV